MALLNTLWALWIGVALLGILISTLFISAVYVLGNLLSNDGMRAWARAEIFEAIYSALILAMALSTVAFVESLVNTGLGVAEAAPNSCGPTITYTYMEVSTGPGSSQEQCIDICGSRIAQSSDSVFHDVNSCHIRLGIWLMRELFEETKKFSYKTFITYTWYSTLQDMSLNFELIDEHLASLSFNPWRGFFVLPSLLRKFVLDTSLKVMMLTKFQEILLRFIAVGLFPVMLVMGVVLRSFSLTRRIGGLFIALALGLYFILPSFYAFGALVVLNLKNEMRAAYVADQDLNPTGSKNPPIADVLYLKGSFPMLGGSSKGKGGDTGFVESSEYLDVYNKLNSMNAIGTEDQNIEDVNKDAIEKLDISDTHDNEWSSLSQSNLEQKIKKDWESQEALLSLFSKRDKKDQLINYAWLPGGPLDILARLTFFSSFFSFIGIFATIAGIRSLSMTFGGDLEIAGLTRLI